MSELRADTITASDGTSPVTLTKQSAAKAWVSFNGSGTIAARGSLNLSSLTDNAAGDYTINYSNSMSDGNYAASGFAGEDADIIGLRSGASFPPSSSSTRIAVKNYASTSVDRTYVLCVTHGDLA